MQIWKLQYKKNKLKLGIDFLNNCKQLSVYPKFLIFKLPNVSNKDVSSTCKRLIRSGINKRNKELQHVLKEFCMSNSFLLLISTSSKNLQYCTTINCYGNCYILKRKNYRHWRGFAAYLYSQLTKLLLTLRNMNYPR